VYSFLRRKSPYIGLIKRGKKKRFIIATALSIKERGFSLASDDSTRFGTATNARDSVVVIVEGKDASRGRSEKRQKLSALTSSE